MSKIYIANTTRQHLRLPIRINEPEKGSKVIRFEIPSGQQLMIGSGFSEDQVADVISHLERFGGKKSVSQKLNGFMGILYSVDKPISEDNIRTGHEAVIDASQKRSATESIRAAESFDTSTRENSGRGKRLARETQVVIERETPKKTGTGIDKEELMNLSVSEHGVSDKTIRPS